MGDKVGGSVIVIVEGVNDNEGLPLELGMVAVIVGVSVLVEGGEEGAPVAVGVTDAFKPNDTSTSVIVGSAVESKSVDGDADGCPDTRDR